MKELREGMDKIGEDMTLTFASAGWERYYNFIETKEVMKYANYMNVMTYDLTTAAVPYTAHHTNFGDIQTVLLRYSSSIPYIRFCYSLHVPWLMTRSQLSDPSCFGAFATGVHETRVLFCDAIYRGSERWLPVLSKNSATCACFFGSCGAFN